MSPTHRKKKIKISQQKPCFLSSFVQKGAFSTYKDTFPAIPTKCKKILATIFHIFFHFVENFSKKLRPQIRRTGSLRGDNYVIFFSQIRRTDSLGGGK